jgi:hypothetical protein
MSTGYRNPPKDMQFAKGRSGNLSGRPKKDHKQRSAAYLFRKVARDDVAIEIGGEPLKMSYWDAYVRQIYVMALNKNNGAARLLDQLRRQFPGDALPGDPITYLMTKADVGL